MTQRRLQLVQRLAITLMAWCTGCNVLAPLEDPLPPRLPGPLPCLPSGCRDAQIDANIVIPDVDSGQEPSHEPPTPGCAPPPGAACDPVARCGCPTGEYCELDDVGWDEGVIPSLACSAPKSPDNKKLDEVCRLTSECEQGLECSVNNLCARYCKISADCGPDATCLSYVNSRADGIDGTGACIRHCDPSAPDACEGRAHCQPASDTSEWDHAICYGRLDADGPQNPEGAPCEQGDDCALNLECARFGPAVCTRYCLSIDDCPDERPVCHFTDQRIEKDKPIGQCVQRCDDETLPPSAAWLDGPVWTKEQLDQCEETCAGAAGCIAMFCPDSMRYQACLQQTRTHLASLPLAACRKQHVAHICSTTGERSVVERMFLNCLESRPELATEAQKTCVSGL